MVSQRHSNGFTLIEMLVVLVIIAGLACLTFPAIRAMMKAAKRSSSAASAQVMVNAIKAYKMDYPTWPGQSQGALDRAYDNSTYSHAIILSALTNNPRGRVYSEVAENITTNAYLDAFDRPFVIVIDENNDGVLNITGTFFGMSFSTNIKETVAIISGGSNPSNQAEWACSWMR